jgi:hypothetical protein
VLGFSKRKKAEEGAETVEEWVKLPNFQEAQHWMGHWLSQNAYVL